MLIRATWIRELEILLVLGAILLSLLFCSLGPLFLLGSYVGLGRNSTCLVGFLWFCSIRGIVFTPLRLFAFIICSPSPCIRATFSGTRFCLRCISLSFSRGPLFLGSCVAWGDSMCWVLVSSSHFVYLCILYTPLRPFFVSAFRFSFYGLCCWKITSSGWRVDALDFVEKKMWSLKPGCGRAAGG